MPPKRRNGKEETKYRLRQKLAAKKGGKKICLNMIVKNEEKNMVRLLESLKNFIDMVSIVDTGSTDNTIEVIEKWGIDNNMPTKVHREPFQDFAYNRTHSIVMAKKSFPDADYFLLSDADMIWEIKPEFSKKLLLDHKYLIEQHNMFMTYWNVRLLSANVDWECVGVTHEYWQECAKQSKFSGQISTTKLHNICIDDKEDGGCKEDKFPRDERLLKKALEDESIPSGLRMRYYFYLAQTLRDMSRNEESIEYYQKRIDCGGWPEEVYYAMYQIGKNNEFLGNRAEDPTKKEEYYDLAIQKFIEAYHFRPSRAEALHSATRLLRSRGKNKEALELALIGKDIPFSQDSLFVEKLCYSYLFDYEISICAFYVPEKKIEGIRACERLLDRDDIPKSLRENVEQNSRFYI